MTIIVMATKSSTQAILAFMQDAQNLKRVLGVKEPTVEFYSDYIEAKFLNYGTLRDIPDFNADEWRMYAEDGALVLVLTYYYEEE